MPEVRATIVISATDLASQKLAGVGKNATKLTGELKQGFGGATQALFGFNVATMGVAGAVGVLAAGMKFAIDQAAESERVMAQTEAVIKSTGMAAGLTAVRIGEMSDRLSRLNAVDDETVQSAANVLLTFKAIKSEAFEPAMQAALDMSTALKTDLQGSIIQVGKALEDPVRGITALRRAGVSFTADQQAMIKTLVDTGRAAEAQALILKELNSQFGGSGAAAAQTYSGQMAALKIAFENLGEEIGRVMLPTAKALAERMTEDTILATALQKALNEQAITFRDVSRIQYEVKNGYKSASEAVEELESKTGGANQAMSDMVALGPSMEAMLGKVAGAVDAEAEAETRNLRAKELLAAGLSGVIGKAQKSYAETVTDTKKELEKVTAELEKYQGMHGKTVTVTKEATVSTVAYTNAQFDAETAALKLSDAQAKLAENTDPEKQRQLYGALLDAQVALEKANDKVTQFTGELGSAKTVTTDYTGKITELSDAQAELQAEIDAAREAMHLATAEFIFNKAAAELDASAALELARSMGLVDEASYATQEALLQLRDKYDLNRDGALSAAEAARGYTGDVGLLNTAIQALQDKQVTITITTIREEIIREIIRQHGVQASAGVSAAGGVVTGAMGSQLAGGVAGLVLPRAHGGPVSAGQMYMVGERGPEYFMPKQAGNIIPNGKGVTNNMTLVINTSAPQLRLEDEFDYMRAKLGVN